MPVVRTDGRTYGHVITKMSRMRRLLHFLRYRVTLSKKLNFLLDGVFEVLEGDLFQISPSAVGWEVRTKCNGEGPGARVRFGNYD